MTKLILITDIMEIKTVKVKCRKCGYAVEVPVGSPEAVPDGCRQCMVLFPSGAVAQLLKGISAMQDALAEKDKFQFMQVLIETEEVPGK